MTVLHMVESGTWKLLSSDALVFEISRIPSSVRSKSAFEILRLASEVIALNDEIDRMTRALMSSGIKAMDALHLASAINSGADYFCTCDDHLLKKARDVTEVVTKMVSPLELVAKAEL